MILYDPMTATAGEQLLAVAMIIGGCLGPPLLAATIHEWCERHKHIDQDYEEVVRMISE